MVSDTPLTQTLKSAAHSVGGEDVLAVLLRVPSDQLELWLSGGSAPPQDVYFRALDLVNHSNSQSG